MKASSRRSRRCAGALPAIAAAAEEAVERLRRGRHGSSMSVAGTSGRIGVQDGTELPPTFNWPDEQGGLSHRRRRRRPPAGGRERRGFRRGRHRRRIRAANVGPNDVVIGVAASGTTPFTIAALKEATSRGAQTIGISNNPDAPILAVCSHPILADTGEEVVAGSTRMKAGTAQKIILNLLSTLIMVRLGRVYRGLMVHMRATNAKLRRRSEIMVVPDHRLRRRHRQSTRSGKSDGDMKIAVAHRPRRQARRKRAARSSATMAICAKPWQTSPSHASQGIVERPAGPAGRKQAQCHGAGAWHRRGRHRHALAAGGSRRRTASRKASSLP